MTTFTPFAESYPDIARMNEAERKGLSAKLAAVAKSGVMGLGGDDFTRMESDAEALKEATRVEGLKLEAEQRAAAARQVETTTAWAARKAREWGIPVPAAA